jgi:hypothetical protein
MAGTFAPDLLRLGFNVLFFFSFITFLILAGFCGHRFRCRRREKSRHTPEKERFCTWGAGLLELRMEVRIEK